MIKIEKHGYFFHRGRLRTECKCGCVYHTPKRKVRSTTDPYTHYDVFETKCPECTHYNRQFLKDLIPKDNNDERSNEDPDERTGAAHI